MERVIVTGATSMIGEALIEECLKHGISVCAVIRKDTARKDRLPQDPHLELVECSLEELAALPEKVTGSFDTFYHIAWGYTGAARNKSTRLQSKNIDYTLDAVEAAAKLGCKRFIGAGSQAEYGRTEQLLSPETPVFPENGYGMAKLCAGQMSRIRCQELGIKHVWVRILSVYGPFDGPNTMVSATLRKLLCGEHAAFTPAEQQWDYLYSEDAARALFLAAEHGKSGKIYVLGSGQIHPLREYIVRIHEAVCERIDILRVQEGQNKYLKAGFVLDHKKINTVVDDSIKKLRIKTPSMKEHIANLSGGNQQKVIVSRWLANDPDVLIMDEPTRGIDVGAKHEIYEIMNDLAKQGKAIIMISSEMAELLGMSDRVCVMCNGRLTGEITEKEEMSQANVMQFATQF